MEMEPFPKGRKPTLNDVVLALKQAHDCVEGGRQETRAVDAKVTALDGKVDGLSDDVARLDGKLDGLAKGLGVHGVHPAQPVKPPKFAIRWDFKTVMAITGAMGGVLILFRILNAVLPAVWGALLQVPIQ